MSATDASLYDASDTGALEQDAAVADASDASDEAEDAGVAKPSDSGADDASDDTAPTCTVDQDCPTRALCVEGRCRQPCLPRVSGEPSECANGEACVVAATPRGGCYNEPGCNPPPPGVICPCLCFGYCP